MTSEHRINRPKSFAPAEVLIVARPWAAAVPDWTRLSQGDLVVLENSSELVGGRVDDISLDASVLWLHLEQGRGRRLFLQADGYTAFRAERTSPRNTESLQSLSVASRRHVKDSLNVDSPMIYTLRTSKRRDIAPAI